MPCLSGAFGSVRASMKKSLPMLPLAMKAFSPFRIHSLPRRSARSLSPALGSSAGGVCYLERGEYSPSLYMALRLAAYFEVPVEVVFSTEPFPRIGSAGMSAS